MCASSMVTDYYQRQWPQNWPQTPNVLTVADEETKSMLRRALALLDKVDKRLGDIECLDKEKAEFLAALASKETKRAAKRARA